MGVENNETSIETPIYPPAVPTPVYSTGGAYDPYGGASTGTSYNTGYDYQQPPPQNVVYRIVYAIPVTQLSANKFIAKVLGIVAAQLLLVAIICAPFIFSDTVKSWIYDYTYTDIYGDPVGGITTTGLVLLILSIVFEFATLIPLFCFSKRKPINFILLFLFTASTGIMIAFTCALYESQVVIEAAAITFVLVVVLIAYALFSKTDFRFLIAYIVCVSFLALMWLIIFLPSCIFWGPGWGYSYCAWYYQGITILFVFLFIGYLLFDVARLKRTLDHDLYILAAINIYLDILNIFLLILRLVGKK